MKEINISTVLVNMRKKKGITQEELAKYIGVSKASVSKWETEQSYPDVTFLPVLASYFDISIDSLLDYKPQMAKEDIQKLYRRLSSDFSTKTFSIVLADCRKTVKKYYSCFPLLLQMGILMMNHAPLLADSGKSKEIIKEAKTLFMRVRTQSQEVSLTRQALYMEALSGLAMEDADAALELLGDSIAPAMPVESLLALAYQMTGQNQAAKEVLQVGIYQNLVVLFNFFPAYLMLCTDDAAKFQEILRRALILAEAFDFKELHPGVIIGLYIAAAQGYLVQKKNTDALEMLEQYAEIVLSDIYPLHLHGDAYFDLLDDWISKLDLGNDFPRDDKTIKKSMTDNLLHNPAFSCLSDNTRFKAICAKLKAKGYE